jgi:monofunctional biosynthetic peptidoglycan transglycosylase
MTALARGAARLLALIALCTLALQLVFMARVALMIVVDPESTSFQRSEAWRLLRHPTALGWRHEWTPGEHISAQLKRAVIAAEDAGFAEHSGVEWEAIERAWERNQQAQSRLQRLSQGAGARALAAHPGRTPRIYGGSTITQQLAKNLFLSGERHLLRKAQELLITIMLEALLSKERILEIYLNNVEWGEGLYGAAAAARHYHRVQASQLDARQAARLAVMLPAPKRFERRPGSPYIAARAAAIQARMSDVELP